MVFQKFIEIGGVVFSEKHQKPAAIVNVISLNRYMYFAVLVSWGDLGSIILRTIYLLRCREFRPRNHNSPL